MKWWVWLIVAWVGADVAIVLAWNLAKAKVQGAELPTDDEDRATATPDETLERTERFARWADSNPFVAAHPAPVLRSVRRGGQ